jgi:hypothetical protein
VDVNAVSEQSGTGHASTGRRVGIAAALVAAALSLTSCAVGQHAATAIDRPAIAGTNASVGSIDLQNVSIQAPNIVGRDTGTKFYTSGDNAPMTLTIVNVGHSADTLTAVTSAAFKSWAIVDTASADQPITGGATSQALAPNERVGLGISDLGVGTGESAQTLVLGGLTGANVYPGTTVDVTFTFATAGSVTMHVPVDLTSSPTTGSIAPIPTDPGL